MEKKLSSNLGDEIKYRTLLTYEIKRGREMGNFLCSKSSIRRTLKGI